jgi:hypothetical protein
MQDAIIVALLSLSLATFVTAHAATTYGLLFHHPRWRAAIALFLPPLAAVWGHAAGMKLRPRALVLSAIVYVAARFAAR